MNNDTIKLYRGSHAFVRQIIQESDISSVGRNNQNADVLTIEESDSVLGRVSREQRAAREAKKAKDASKKKMDENIAKVKETVSNATDKVKESVKDTTNKVKESVKDTTTKGATKAKDAVLNNKGKIAMGAAALTTLDLSRKALSDDEITESGYSTELYSKNPNDGDPTKESNDDIADASHKTDETKTEKGKNDGIEYAHKTLQKEENLVGNPKPENAVAVETVEESGSNVSAASAESCCESCKTGGECESTLAIQESTTPAAHAPTNLYSIISKII